MLKECQSELHPTSSSAAVRTGGFPPLHPERLRVQGYEHFITYLRHHMRHAVVLRIDHVMAFHRLYCVPFGMGATDGVYVQYFAEEFAAIVCLESQRSGCQIVGENLGTVPPAVTEAMERHAFAGMYVGQFGARPGEEPSLASVPKGTVASLNTHDTPTFKAFWDGLDVDVRLKLGLITPEAAEAERAHRKQEVAAVCAHLAREDLLPQGASDPASVLDAWLAYLGRSAAKIAVVSLEDFWLEPLPQNLPGTSHGTPNWLRKAKLSIEEILTSPEVRGVLHHVNRERNGGQT